MMRFTLVTVGKQKRGPLLDLRLEYEKRLGSFAKMDSVVVDEVRSVPSPAFKILLTEHGKTYSSPVFAQQLAAWTENETRPLQFVVAGPFGIEKSVEKQFDATLSLSPMTMPHEMATVVLLEQLYRACTILKGKTYHY